MAGDTEEPIETPLNGTEDPGEDEIEEVGQDMDLDATQQEGQSDCNLDDLGLEEGFSERLDSGKSWKRILGIHGQEKEDLFKSLMVQIDNYNKYLVEEAQLISANRERVSNFTEVKQSICNAHQQLEEAINQLERNDIISGLGLYYSAREKRVKIIQALDEIDNGNRLEAHSRRLLQKGEKYCGKEWADEAKNALFEGEIFRPDICSQEIIPWVREIHRGVYRELSSTLLVRTILSHFILLNFFILPLLVLSIFLSGLLNGINLSEYTFISSSSSTPIIEQLSFIFLVFLLGVLGSAVNTVRKWPSQLMTLQPEQPRLAITRRLIAARLLFGGIAALITSLLLISEAIVIQPTPGLLIFAAFVSGFTDQFFIAGIERSLESKFESGELSPKLFDDDSQ